MGSVSAGVSTGERKRTPTEEIVARIWAEELRLQHIGLDEDFIDLGSHSLQGVAVVARLQEIFGVAIPVRVLFEEPTVADLAGWIDQHRPKTEGTHGEIIRFKALIGRQRLETGETRAKIICLQEGRGLRPIFAVPGGRAAARALYGLGKLARETDRNRPFYAFPGAPPVPSDTPEESWVQAAAASLNDAMRIRQRNGAYLLLGTCIGGIIGWEMARQLEASGEIVHLFLVDTKHPKARPAAEARWRTEKRMRRLDRNVKQLRLDRTRAYRPEPLVGRVRLLANSDWHQDHPTLGWDARFIDCRDVAVMPPLPVTKEHGILWNFTEVAGWLRTGLEVVDPQPQSSPPVERQSPPSDLAAHSALEMAPSGAVSTSATIVDTLMSRAERAPDALALLGPEDDGFTYSQLAVEVDRLAGVLRRIGVGRDDPVHIVLPDGPALVTMILAAMTAGIAAPLARDMTRHEYIEAMSHDAGRIVVLPAGQESPARDAATELGLPIVELALAPPGTAERFHLVGDPIGPPAASRRPQLDDIALVISSSGTTGRPKRVPRTHRNITTTSADVCRMMWSSPSDRCLSFAPMAFSQGLNALLNTLWAGGSLVALPGFDLARLPDRITQYRPTWFSATPSVLRMVATNEVASSTIRKSPPRFIRASAGAISATEIAYLEDRLATPVLHSYGLSEASFIAGEQFAAASRKPGSAGLPIHEVAIIEANGTPVAAGAIGEIIVRGPNVFPGYLGDPDANAAAILPEGWFRTGDLGRIDEDGYLFVTGRLKEMIKRAGLSISPLEIEEALLDDPAVAEACVLGIPHPDLGDDVVAAVVLRSGAVVTERRLRDRVASRLSAQKVPRVIAFVTEIPKTPTGKPMRGELAETLETLGKRPVSGGFSSRTSRRNGRDSS